MANRFLTILKSGKILLLDGGMGTMLQAAGMPSGMSPEKFCLNRPEVLRGIHKAYIEAGADIITSCTFGSSAFKLEPGMEAIQVNRRLASIAVQCAREYACDKPVLVAGDVGPCGLFAKPLGDVEPERMIAVFEEQIRGLWEAGVDLIFLETQFDLAEARAAAVACRHVCDLPVLASMTFEEGRSLTGSTPEIFAETMLNLGVAALGSNCSLGPVEMFPVGRELLKVSDAPVMIEPNAGLPRLVDGKTVFPMGPEAFAVETAKFAEMGARILGGCCGTTPEHIRALANLVAGMEARPLPRSHKGAICLTSRSCIARIGGDEPLVIIGERINPTGKPALAADLQAGGATLALEMASAQLDAGASVLDVNVGAPMVDEETMLAKLVSALVASVQAPLSLDSANAAAIAKALPFWPGSCLVNSISGEGARMAELGPFCRDFGSPFILLPLAGAQLPVLASERIAIVEKLLTQAADLGIPERLVMVDILALAASSAPDAANQCLKMAQWCRERHLPCVIGLSNISFGLPARALLNSVFLAMARGAGLSSCIANPQMQTIRQTADAMSVLQNGPTDDFIAGYAGWKAGAAVEKPAGVKAEIHNLYDCVLFGDKEHAKKQIEMELASGKQPFELVNDILIPAINEVGERYARKEYFLPQLIRSAETMKTAFAMLLPLLEAARGPEKRPVIVMATVEGDIHDIGKNIVSLLLGNHGFEVVDAGKDVPAEDIVDCAIRHNAGLIGLSALMTTTMVRMEDTIRLLRERNLPIKVMVGGAAVTQDFADSIGADRYCETAVDSVAAAREFLLPQ